MTDPINETPTNPSAFDQWGTTHTNCEDCQRPLAFWPSRWKPLVRCVPCAVKYHEALRKQTAR